MCSFKNLKQRLISKETKGCARKDTVEKVVDRETQNAEMVWELEKEEQDSAAKIECDSAISERAVIQL